MEYVVARLLAPTDWATFIAWATRREGHSLSKRPGEAEAAFTSGGRDAAVLLAHAGRAFTDRGRDPSACSG